MRFVSLLVLFVSLLLSFDINIPDSTVANGRTAFIEFKKDSNITYEHIVVDKKSYKIFSNPVDTTMLYALLPINYYEKPRDKKVKVIYKELGVTKSKTLFFRVEDGVYKKEKIHVQSSKVSLSESDKTRAAKEYAEAMKIYKRVTPENYISQPFILPLNSKITSSFGKARVYNDTLKGYHSGTDFRAKVGTPLVSCNEGVVVLAQDRFYSGGSVVIDHGQGVYSCYFHMSKFEVTKGERVKRGERIGLSGDTGRVTGPHLHFSFRVGGEQVDPLQLIELLNKNLLKVVQ